jgi:hypothetical protein
MPAPAHHDNDKTATRFIIVKESREISRGRTQSGSEYTMWQLICTKPDGTPIAQNLRSFEDMPRGEVLEVSVTPFVSQQWGTSYTVARKDKSELHRKVEELETRIATLEKLLNVVFDPNPPGQGPPPLPPSVTSVPPPPTISNPNATADDGEVPF